MNIWRLNVRATQIEECIHSKKFALDTHPIEKGDILLLQLVASDADKFDKRNSRIEFALFFDHYQEDTNGLISKVLWPNAGKTWRWILHCSDISPTMPFSLENLNLKYNYSGQTNPMRIHPEDVNTILPYILSYPSSEENIGYKVHRVLKDSGVDKEYSLWALVKNNDRIIESAPDKIEWTTTPARKEIKRNTELPCVLKELYSFKCQVCGYNFKPRYPVAYSETHHILWLSRGGIDHSNNLIVVCPNHHRIIHEAKPKFDREQLAFVYNNGLTEHLDNEGHLKDSKLLNKIEEWAVEREKEIKKEVKGNTE